MSGALPCEHCGSVACLLQSPEVCRHTRRLRQKGMSGPPADKMVKSSTKK